MSDTQSRGYNRPALIVLVVVASVACLALGWWQWQRFDSAAGTGQNLGYALQWPLFSGFAVFAYFRFVRLEQESNETTEEPNGNDTGSTAEAHDTDAPSGTRVGTGTVVGHSTANAHDGSSDNPSEHRAPAPANTSGSEAARRTARARTNRIGKRTSRGNGPREIPAGILPEPPKAATDNDTDPVLTEYNSYLAQLHADDVGEQVREAGLEARDTERSAG